MTVARGIRNNNPGNIRWDEKTNWLGMVGQDDKGFIVFDTPEYGIRAEAKILKSYARRGVITLENIISTWAPPIENETESYIKSVAARTGLSRFDVVAENNYPLLIEAINYHENGSQPYSMAIIEKGVSLE